MSTILSPIVASSSHTEEYWPSVVFARTERSEVCTKTPSDQYSSLSIALMLVSERLVFHHSKTPRKQFPSYYTLFYKRGFAHRVHPKHKQTNNQVNSNLV